MLAHKLFMNTTFVEEGITGSGVLDVFDRYNFTVNEVNRLKKKLLSTPKCSQGVENLIEETGEKAWAHFYTHAR